MLSIISVAVFTSLAGLIVIVGITLFRIDMHMLFVLVMSTTTTNEFNSNVPLFLVSQTYFHSI